MHARLTARKQACMHAQHDARSTSGSMRLKEGRERHPRIHTIRPTGGSPTTITLSPPPHTPSRAPPIRSLPYTRSHLTLNPLRATRPPTRLPTRTTGTLLAAVL